MPLLSSKSADALLWLASSENKDVELRAEAKSVLDKLLYIDQLDARITRP